MAASEPHSLSSYSEVCLVGWRGEGGVLACQSFSILSKYSMSVTNSYGRNTARITQRT